MHSTKRVRIAALGDVHCTRASAGRLAPLFQSAARSADVLLLCGDLTDYGLPDEALILSRELEGISGIPILAVLGNHDFEAGRQEEVMHILTDNGVQIMDGTAFEAHGIGFAGTKGFGGGFGDRALQPWGEAGIKAFVREAIDESLKLESALAKARSTTRVAVLHYAPIAKTVEGEPVEIYPFLGSSRLADPIDRFRVSLAVHGHAHRGFPEGRTRSGVPVYNVALPLLRQYFPTQPPFRLLEIEAPAQAEKVPV